MQVGREDEFSINRLQMHARIRVCMGGTVAEELVFGQDQVSSGATDDLRQVGLTLERGAGTLAKELVFGQDQVSSGATNDLQEVGLTGVWPLGLAR